MKITNMCNIDFLYSFNTRIIKILRIFPIKPNVQIKTEKTSFMQSSPEKLLCSAIISGKTMCKYAFGYLT